MQDINKIKYFQHIFLLFIVVIVLQSKKIKNFLEKNIYKKLNDEPKNKYINKSIRILIALIPAIIYFYYDSKYSTFSMNNLGVTNVINEKQLNMILQLIGSYIFVDIINKNLDIEYDNNQLFILIINMSIAYTIIQDKNMSFLVGLSHILIKHLT
jgi:hypothetical protein